MDNGRLRAGVEDQRDICSSFRLKYAFCQYHRSEEMMRTDALEYVLKRGKENG